MNSQTTMSNSSSSSSEQDSSDSQSDSRLTVADILSSMANGEVITSLQYTAVDGFSTGIPTRTTPTLTPTTLRNIEQTFIELQSVPPPINHNHQAGFVPPIINTATTTSSPLAVANFPLTVPVKEESSAAWYQCPLSTSRSSSKSGASPQSRLVTSTSGGTTRGRHMGGRRPRDDKLSPEEEERRRVRRERNKLAAARCRKRRLDHTNQLLNETEGLEDKRQELQDEIKALKNQKDRLEFILQAHQRICKHNGKVNSNGVSVVRNGDLKEMAMASPLDIRTSVAASFASSHLNHKPMARPTTLSISSSFATPTSTCMKVNTSIASEIVGIPITTPSTGIFNFDSLLEGSTGLTPVSTGLTPIIPTCSSQQRSSNSDLSSPDNMNPPKLVSL